MSYQLICPKCKHEFCYNNERYDNEIARLGHEIQDIILQRAEHRKLPYNIQRQRDDWWNRSRKALAEKQKQLQDLKARRKLANEQAHHNIDHFFRQLVREELGDEKYVQLKEKADKLAEAYSISDMRKHQYTTGKTPVTSIGKL